MLCLSLPSDLQCDAARIFVHQHAGCSSRIGKRQMPVHDVDSPCMLGEKGRYCCMRERESTLYKRKENGATPEKKSAMWMPCSGRERSLACVEGVKQRVS